MQIVFKRHPFQRQTERLTIDAGITLAEAVSRLPGQKGMVEISVNGEPVNADQWAMTTISENDFVVCYAIPEGGGIGIAALIMAAFNPAFLLTFAGTFAVTRDFDKSVQTASFVGFGPLAPLASYAILGPGKVSGGGGTDPLTHSITGISNRIAPFAPIPIVCGKHLVFPVFPGKFPTQYTEIVGDDQYLLAYFVVGKGPLKFNFPLKLGDTEIQNFDDVQYEIREGRPGDTPITLYTRGIQETALSVALTSANGYQTRTTPLGSDLISVDWTFFQGLQHLKKSGKRIAVQVDVEIEYNPTSNPADRVNLGIFTKIGSTTSVVRKNHYWLVPPEHKDPNGQYDVHLRRTTPDRVGDEDFDETTWTAIRGIPNINITTEPNLAAIAIRIKANDQLNGLIENLNIIAESEYPTFDGTNWTAGVVSRNPAWAIAWLLTGPGNTDPLPLTRLNGASFKAFADHCTANGFNFDYVFDTDTTVFEACNLAAAVGRGSLDNVDGQYVIIFDAQQSVIRDHFTPRTIWGLEGRGAFPEKPHGYRINFLNEELNYQQDERIVYDDTYNDSNATKLEVRDYPGITNKDHAWKHGRYELAATRLRFEEWEFNEDFRRLIVTRGDLGVLSHDVMLVGLGWGRIKRVSLVGSNVSAILLDTTVTMGAGKTYGVQIQKSFNNSQIEGQVVNTLNETNELTFISPVSGVPPSIGDLVVFGEWGKISQRVIVKAIKPIRDNGSLAARLTVVAEAPTVYTAHTGSIGAHTPIITIPSLPANLRPPTPTIRTVRSNQEVSLVQDSGYFAAQMVVAYGFQSNFTPSLVLVQAQYRIYVDDGTGFNPHPWINTPMEDGTNGEIKIRDVEVIMQYEVRVRSLNRLNNSLISPWSDKVIHTVLGDTIPPDIPTNVTVQATDRGASLRWFNPVDDIGNTIVDFDATEIYRSLTNDSATSIFLAETKGETWLDSKLVNGTTYYYWLRARDFAGNLSPFHAGQTSGAAVTPTPNVVHSKAEVRLASKTLSALETFLTLNYTAKGSKIRVEGILFVDAATNDPSATETCDIALERDSSILMRYNLSFKKLGPGYPGNLVFKYEDQPAAGAVTYNLKYAGSGAKTADAINIGIFVEEIET